MTTEFMSVTGIAHLAKVPRTSAFKALQKLKVIAFVESKKIRLKNQHLYKRVQESQIGDAIDYIKKDILKLTLPQAEESLHSNNKDFPVVYLSGKNTITASLIKMMSMEKGERIFTIQASGTTKEWIKKIGEENVLQIHKLFKDNGLIVVSVQGNKSPKDFGYSKEVLESFRGRLNDSHIVIDDFFENKTSLYVYRSTVLFVDLTNLVGIEIRNKLFSNVLKKIIYFMSHKTERVRDMFQ